MSEPININSETATLTFDFEITVEDFLAFQKQFVLKTISANKKVKYIKWGYPLFMAYIFYTVFPTDGSSKIITSAVLVACVALWLKYFEKIVVSRSLRMAKKFIANPKNSHSIGMVNMQVKKEGIYLIIKGSEGLTSWDNIIETEETPNYLFIYYTTSSAIVIAKKGLEDKIITLKETLKEQQKPHTVHG
jgi:hypothetical protein